MPFNAVNWTPNELVGQRKMNTMTNNAEWLYANTPRAIYTLPGGLRRVEGTKLASGRVIITKRNKDSATVEVRFGNYFTARCEPNITTGIIAASQPQVFDSIRGIGRLIPDNRGFQVTVNIAAQNARRDKITRSFYVAWQAMGY